MRGRIGWAGFGLLVAVSVASAAPPRNLDPGPGVTEVVVLSQNWADAEAERFYTTPQGSKLLPFQWFLHLEQPDSDQPFRAADHIRGLGYLARTPDPATNEHGLPIGFVEDGQHLGLTCAACHTALVTHNQKGYLIDGGPTHGDFEEFLRRLALAVKRTHDDAATFGRFADRVLGATATPAARAGLKADLKAELAVRESYNRRNLPAAGAARFGPGRVDAFGAIMNQAAEVIAGVPGNSAPADAPVSYPFLWDTPQLDFVQWNGSAENRTTTHKLLQRLVGTARIGALGRNAGEVLGVFGTMDASQQGSLLQLKGYPSSVRRANLIALEESLAHLWSPEWPAAFPPIDPVKRDQGAVLFRKHCQGCHDPIDRDDPERAVKARMAAVGTDPTMATNFKTRTAKTGHLDGRLIELLALPPRRFEGTAPAGLMLRHLVQRAVLQPDSSVLAAVAKDKAKLLQVLQELDDQIDYKVAGEVAVGGPADGGVRLPGRFSLRPTAAGGAAAADITVAYKGRPLNGIWATAPYLHNGSVPNLDELLLPAGKRSKEMFKVGSREFDPVKVGFKTDNGVDFDPTKPGNLNTGHDYEREFTDEERRQLIEYMKSL